MRIARNPSRIGRGRPARDALDVIGYMCHHADLIPPLRDEQFYIAWGNNSAEPSARFVIRDCLKTNGASNDRADALDLSLLCEGFGTC